MEHLRSLDTNEATDQPVDALVVLGKNWHQRWKIWGKPQEGTTVRLSEDSMRSTIAGAELYLQGKAEKIIFSTGHTIGEAYPAEAEAMKMYLRNFYTEEEIPEEDILVEDRSPDTPGNAAEVKKVAKENGLESLEVVTVDYHLPRAITLFENQGLHVTRATSAESVLEERGFALQERSKLKKVKEHSLEFALRQLLKIDPNGEIPGKLTSFLR